jgi:uncharacterized membrane protein (DUF4010 family)
MFLRILLVLTLINRDLAAWMQWPMLLMAAPLFVAALAYARRGFSTPVGPLKLRNPVEIKEAMRFGLLLAAVLLVSKAVEEWWGHAGLFALAAAAGIGDVDAITVSVARMGELFAGAASQAVIITAMVNTLSKGIFTRGVGGAALAWRVWVPMAVTLAIGAVFLVLRGRG